MSRSWVRMSGALAPPWTRLTHGALTGSPMASMAGLCGVHRSSSTPRHIDQAQYIDWPDSSRESRSTSLARHLAHFGDALTGLSMTPMARPRSIHQGSSTM